MLTLGDGKFTQKKQQKYTTGWTDGTQKQASVQASDKLVHCVKTQVNRDRQMNR
jgi:hypothetical protein